MTINSWLCLVLGFILPIVVGATDQKTYSRMTEKNNKQNVPLYTLPQDCDFRDVRNNLGQEFECSPRLVERFFSEFRGLLINGPKETVWPKSISLADISYNRHGNTKSPSRLMITGLARILHSTLGLEGDVGYEVLVVAVNQYTAEVYRGKMRRYVVPEPRSKYSHEDPTRVAEINFNLDLVHNLHIPIRDAVYTVYATLGEYKSNVLTIKINLK